MDKLVVALTYYNCPLMLQEQMKYWQGYPDELTQHVKVILIDDGSVVHPAEKEIKKALSRIPVELYRIKQDICQNTFGARNLALHIAKNESAKWVLCLDIDHVLPQRGLEGYMELKPGLHPSFYYYPLRYRKQQQGIIALSRHIDTYLLTPDLFWEVGGYDEDLTGYYYNGPALHFRLGLSRKTTGIDVDNLHLFFYPSTIIPDASPLQNQERKIYEGVVPRNKKPSVLNFDWERVL